MQFAEILKRVPAPRIQEVPKQIPRYETQLIERVVPAPMTLIQETAVEVPQVCVHEVVRQVASAAQQQRIVQTGVEYERPVRREEVVQQTQEPQYAGAYEAQERYTQELDALRGGAASPMPD